MVAKKDPVISLYQLKAFLQVFVEAWEHDREFLIKLGRKRIAEF